MIYKKIHPFDMYRLIEKSTATAIEIAGSDQLKPLGEVTITISGPGVVGRSGEHWYSFTQPLIEFEGTLYLRTTTVSPSKEAVDEFDVQLRNHYDLMLKRQAAHGPFNVTYEPESDDAPRPLPRYKCHKEVSALKIKAVMLHAHPDPGYDDAKWIASDEFQGGHIFPEEAGFAPIPFNADWYLKHKPQPGGYYVFYQDGYTSFSPGKAFEEGYTLIRPNP